MKEGRKEKGLEIVEGFNPLKPGLSQKALSQMVIEENRKREARRIEALAAVQAKKDAVRAQLEMDAAEAEVLAEIEEEKKASRDLSDDGRSAKRMLEDLRFAYRNTLGQDGKKGRARLAELMKADVDFKYFVKELIKIEISLMAAEARRAAPAGTGSGATQQNFFVMLKGLDVANIDGSPLDKTVDMKQIQGILDPERKEYVEDAAEDKQAPPDMLLGRSLEGDGE